MKHKVYITREKRGLGCFGAGRLIRRAVRAVLEEEGIASPCEVSVLLTDGPGIRELNGNFRDTDRETDVLSFPANEMTAGEFDPSAMEINPNTGRIVLGDMALSIPRAVEQGNEFGHGTKREIMYLTIHSVLHLLGYDHVDEGEMKRQMRQREKAVMSVIEGKTEE